MHPVKPVKITSVGKYLPQQVDSNELEARHGLPQGWSFRYSGVEARHMVTNESNGCMGSIAADRALTNANMTLADIQLIISAGGSYDYPIPNQASIIKSKMKDGLHFHTPAIDLDSTCLSFVTALDLSSKLLDGLVYKNILIVSAEISSKAINPANWETLTLFGDAAAAVVVSYDEECGSTLIKGQQKTYSQGVYNTIIEGGGNMNSFKDHPYNPEFYSFKMEGKKLLRLAKATLPGFFDDFYQETDYNMKNIDVFIPHQASKSGMLMLNKLFDFRPECLISTLHKYGNCIAASIPLTLVDAIDSGELKRGDICLLAGTSAGFAIGAVLFKY